MSENTGNAALRYMGDEIDAQEKVNRGRGTRTELKPVPLWMKPVNADMLHRMTYSENVIPLSRKGLDPVHP